MEIVSTVPNLLDKMGKIEKSVFDAAGVEQPSPFGNDGVSKASDFYNIVKNVNKVTDILSNN